MAWDVDTDHYIFLGFDQVPENVGRKALRRHKTTVWEFFKMGCDCIREYASKFQNALLLRFTPGSIVVCLGVCVCVCWGNFSKVFSLLLMCNVARINACVDVFSYVCV